MSRSRGYSSVTGAQMRAEVAHQRDSQIGVVAACVCAFAALGPAGDHFSIRQDEKMIGNVINLPKTGHLVSACVMEAIEGSFGFGQVSCGDQDRMVDDDTRRSNGVEK